MNLRAQPDGLHPAMITVAVMAATLMQVLDTTIAMVALPKMQGSLSATQDQIAWVLTSYIVGAAIMTPPTGWLAGRFGRKRIFMIAIVGFTTASFLCGVTQTLSEMVFFRILQGLFGAALVPISQAVLLDTFPREKHGAAMALFGVGIMLGPILGPTLGGYLTEYYSWRWVFFINIPIGLISFLMTASYVPETEINRKRTFDSLGFVYMSLAIGALQMLLDRGERLDWFSSPEIMLETALAISGFWFFLIHSRATRHPFIDITLFRDRNFVLSNVVGLVVFLSLFSTMSLIPPLLQNLLGYPVLLTGMLLMPRGIGTMLSMIVVGRLSQKIDPRLNIVVGLSIMAFAMYVMSGFTTGLDNWIVIWTGFVQGIGMGQVIVPLTTMAFSTLPSVQRTEGTGVYNLIRNIGGSVGISISFTLLDRNTQINHSTLADTLTPFSQRLDLTPLAGQLHAGSTGILERLNGLVTQQAAMIGFNNDFKLMMAMSFLAVPLVFLLKRPRYDTPEAASVHAE